MFTFKILKILHLFKESVIFCSFKVNTFKLKRYIKQYVENKQ